MFSVSSIFFRIFLKKTNLGCMLLFHSCSACNGNTSVQEKNTNTRIQLIFLSSFFLSFFLSFFSFFSNCFFKPESSQHPKSMLHLAAAAVVIAAAADVDVDVAAFADVGDGAGAGD